VRVSPQVFVAAVAKPGAAGIGGRHRRRIHSSYEPRNAPRCKPLAARRDPLLACSLTPQSTTPMTRHPTSIDQAAACGVLGAFPIIGVCRSGSAGKPVHRRGGAANGLFAAAF